MKKILMIATGGTIASKSSDNGLSPAMDCDEVLEYVPSVLDFCTVGKIQLFNLDSTNVKPKHWLTMVATIEENYEDYDGFVILHGTDTMAYTAAALSYLIQKSPKPIVLTGAQRPVDKEITDAKLNLYDSFLYACDDDSDGVNIVFDGHVICGTRARKSRSKSFNAFSSINYPDIAQIRNNRIIRYIKKDTNSQGPVFYKNLCDKIFVMKLIPGIQSKLLGKLKDDYDAVIIESFGVGGVPHDEEDSFMTELRQWSKEGKMIVMSTQVTYEGSDIGVYAVGMQVKGNVDCMESGDMTMEATVTKLMWAMGQSHDYEQVKQLFYQPINHDLTEIPEA